MNGAILLAAGSGTRYKGKKQDELFKGKPLWQHVYDSLREVVDSQDIVVVGKDIVGGVTRTGSVINGLRALPKETDRVVIAEAARPLVMSTQIQELLECVHPSVSFVRPLVDTVIYRDGRYLNRDELYTLLTPQCFDYKLLLQAYLSGKYSDFTDDTRVMYEYHGIKPYFIETGNNLFKVTYPGDMQIIESIYNEQNRRG